MRTIRLISDSYVGVDLYDGRKHDADCCVCRVECDEECLNRASFYECDHQNCGLQSGKDCSNRAFQEAALAYTIQDKSCGVEVFDVSALHDGNLTI